MNLYQSIITISSIAELDLDQIKKISMESNDYIVRNPVIPHTSTSRKKKKHLHNNLVQTAKHPSQGRPLSPPIWFRKT